MPATGSPPPARLPRAASITIAALAVAFLAAQFLMPSFIGGRLRAVAERRHLDLHWRTLRWTFPGHVAIRELTVRNARGEQVATADSVDVRLALLPLLVLRTHVAAIGVARAQVMTAVGPASDADTLDLEVVEEDAHKGDRIPGLRRMAERWVRGLVRGTGELPRLALRDVVLASSRGDEGDTSGVAIADFSLYPSGGGATISSSGTVLLKDPITYTAALDRRRDGHVTGRVEFTVPGEHQPIGYPLTFDLDARLTTNHDKTGITLAPESRVTIGRIPLTLGGALSSRGPHLQFALDAKAVAPGDVAESIPPPMLGPLQQVRLRGTFDYALRFDLDLAQPDSVDFHADVTSHGLALDPAHTTLRLTGLDQPFMATIHLPHDRLVTRELTIVNPHFRTLGTIDSNLVHAVVTNEDGGFFRHRGFNTDAVKSAIVENLRAGAFRRGAGTITMQLARNLYLGHERTVSRKGQEVVLAWILEHLTGLSKQRLLEIYLNIIEWGPGVHGADEATSYYFGHDAGHVTVDEALFLATVVPAPTKWRYRFDSGGALRASERAQMHFIGRAMIAKGWLAADHLPGADSLSVDLRGPARDVLFPPADTTMTPAVEADSLRGADADTTSR
jgi:Transglycosylase